MKIKFSALATVFLLASGCAQNATVKPPAEPAVSSQVASATARGSSSAGTQHASAGPAGRTRADVHAEALEAVRRYKSTMAEELEYFNPYQ